MLAVPGRVRAPHPYARPGFPVIARPYTPPVRGFGRGAVAYQHAGFQPGGYPAQGVQGAHLYEQTNISLSEVCSRYPRMAISTDLVKVVQHWPDEEVEVPLNVAIPFHTDPDLTLPVPAAEPEPKANEPKIIARVMLLSVAKPEEPEDEKKKLSPSHISKQIKFLVAKKATGGLMSIGGPWSAKKDGGDPKTDKALIKAATRHCKEICGIDLSACKTWYKFIEIKYKRESGVEDRTVVFLPDIWNTLAKKKQVDVYKQIETKEVEEEEEVEEEIEAEEDGEAKEGEEKKKVTKKIKKKVTKMVTKETVAIRSMDLSLNGILEYAVEDKHEETVELSLFAECFDNMLSSKFAKEMLPILQEKKAKYEVQVAELKRKREEEAAERAVKVAADKEERDAKRQKLEEDKKAAAELKAAKDEEEKNMTEEELKERREKEAEEKKQKEEEAKKKREEEVQKKKEELEAKKKAIEEEKLKKAEEAKNKKTKTQVTTISHVNEAILAPFAFFDKPAIPSGQQQGFLRRDQVEGILLGMGSLCSRDIDGMMRGCGLSKDNRSGSLHYKALATTTTTETKEVPIEEPKKEEEAMKVDGEAKEEAK